MAAQNFTDAMKHSQHLTILAPDGREFDGYYCDPKMDRRTLPEGWNAYDIRHDDDGCGIFVELCHNCVLVNNAGTFFFEGQIPELADPGSCVDFEIDPEEWSDIHSDHDVLDTESDGSAWNYTF